jgi:hypothetical protein
MREWAKSWLPGHAARRWQLPVTESLGYSAPTGSAVPWWVRHHENADMGSADADAVEGVGVAEGDGACRADDVGADPVVGVAGPVAWSGFGPGGVGGRRGGMVRQRPVRPVLVVGGGEGVEEGLELGERAGLGVLGGEPVLEGLLESFDFALGLGWFGRPFFWVMPRRRSSCSMALRPPRPPEYRVVNTILNVSQS